MNDVVRTYLSEWLLEQQVLQYRTVCVSLHGIRKRSRRTAIRGKRRQDVFLEHGFDGKGDGRNARHGGYTEEVEQV